MNFPLLSPEELKSELQRSGRRGLALDIDETLCVTNRYWLEKTVDLLPMPEGITKDEMLAQYNFLEDMPFWTKEQVFEAVGRYLHSNEFQLYIPLIENANHAVNEIHSHIPIVAYITARPVSVAEGTRAWLSNHGFPDAPLVLKPLTEDHYARNHWKGNVLRSLYPEVLGIVDDNPGLSVELSENYEGTVFVYNSSVHPNQNYRIIPCPDWDSVKTAVKEFASRSAIL